MDSADLAAAGTGYVRFDPDGRLVEAAPGPLAAGLGAEEIDGGEAAMLARLLATAVRPAPAEAVRLWRGSTPFEVTLGDGRTLSLSSCATPDGGMLYVATGWLPPSACEREDDQVIRQVLDGCPANILMCRIETGEIIYRTPAWAKLFGPTRFAREHYADPADRAGLLARLLPTGAIDDYPVRCRRGDGSVFPGLCSARIVDYLGEDVIVSTITDISQALEQEAALRRATERLGDAIESLDQGFAIYDAEGRLEIYNQRYRELNAHIAHAIRPGVAWSELLDAAIASGQLCESELAKVRAATEVDAQGRPLRLRQEYRHRSGRWFSVARTPTSDGGFVITRLDITGQKRREAAEREADAGLRRVLDACPLDLVMCRLSDGEVLFRSAWSTERYGETKTATEYWADESARQRFMAELARSGKVDGLEMDMCRPGGGTVRVALWARLAEFRGETVVVSHAYDLTERITMEAELARQREVLHQSEKLSALGELLAGIAHELNNPLSVVVGHALMLEEETTDPAQRARIAKIVAAADRCARIVRTFLAMARQRPTRMERVSLAAVLETALDITAYSLRPAGVGTVLRLEPDLPPIRADADQLVQVFTNILLNAESALAGKEGERLVTISARTERPAGEVVVKVKDNGPGMPAAIRNRIFEPFFTTKAVSQGTGIGLAFCHRIVEGHGGRIYVRSAPGKGASFFIRLPVAAPGDAAMPNGRGAVPGNRGAAVLVVEDEPEIAALIGEILETDGHSVHCAASGDEALALLDTHSIDFVLSDLKMPGLDGPALFEQIGRRFPDLVDRLAFITGDALSPSARSFLSAAGRPCLEKPVLPADLRALMARLCEEEGAA